MRSYAVWAWSPTADLVFDLVSPGRGIGGRRLCNLCMEVIEVGRRVRFVVLALSGGLLVTLTVAGCAGGGVGGRQASDGATRQEIRSIVQEELTGPAAITQIQQGVKAEGIRPLIREELDSPEQQKVMQAQIEKLMQSPEVHQALQQNMVKVLQSPEVQQQLKQQVTTVMMQILSQGTSGATSGGSSTSGGSGGGRSSGGGGGAGGGMGSGGGS